MNNTVYVYDDDKAEFVQVDLPRKNSTYLGVIGALSLVILGLIWLLLSPTNIVKTLRERELRAAVDYLLEENTKLAQQVIETNKRQLAFYDALGINVSIEDSLDLLSLPPVPDILMHPDSLVVEAQKLNRFVDSAQARLQKERLILDYIPGVCPLDYKDLIIADTVTGKFKISLFGMRMHPILKLNKQHTGMDFAVPIGTPVFATAAGYIEFVGENSSGYGLQIRIKHGESYKTVYAHLNTLAPGIKVGRKVQRNQHIGYSGNSGMSTGPHLHYEILARVPDQKQYIAKDPLQFMQIAIDDPKLIEALTADFPMFENF